MLTWPSRPLSDVACCAQRQLPLQLPLPAQRPLQLPLQLPLPLLLTLPLTWIPVDDATSLVPKSDKEASAVCKAGFRRFPISVPAAWAPRAAGRHLRGRLLLVTSLGDVYRPGTW